MERENLWAPWRINYIQGLTNEEPCDCFICHYLSKPEDDDKNFVLWRSEYGIVLFNRYPYNNGHLMVAPVRHISDIDDASEDELLELIKLVREAKKALTMVLKPHGFNVGINLGRCAGAGLPGHVHIHIVPRWDGDTSFMSVCSNTDVISQSMKELLEQLRKVSAEHNLPGL
ncbi:MAG TPA: HIT domain-containing protein [Sedimentisphaerales bacterium]|nr:HIT domain-containing protein [Sedimentisphaerales bacterium]